MSDGFTKAEREAMKERAAELRAEKGGKKKADNLQALLDKIEGLSGDEKKLAVALHQVVTREAPGLDPRTWYGMQAYEKDGAVLVFLQLPSKFGTRYATLGFNDGAQLDDGDMWPTSYAIAELTDGVRAQVATLVRRAVAD
ncbi:DUF1801 domain-containing protein [Nigerium massiliense]|uniref:DUF1801 domain-containing protein n=1 Tax=Nigerium massiliense TaxID=1522317 RepID=UPI00058EF48A|nr:DUF1801 domain-containing protein [Nigerium massiliense]